MLPFELDASVREVVDEVADSTPGIQIRVDGGSQELWVRGDRGRIQQVIANLLTNAIKYSEKSQDVAVRIWREGDRALVSVTDYGIGIPESQLGEVFELYFRGDNASANNYSGLGLGLYISRVIVERHEGGVGVSSREGEGSTFHFWLPIIASEPGPVPTPL